MRVDRRASIRVMPRDQWSSRQIASQTVAETYAALGTRARDVLSGVAVTPGPSASKAKVVSIAPALAVAPEVETELIEHNLLAEGDIAGRLTPLGLEVAHHAKLMKLDPQIAAQLSAELEHDSGRAMHLGSQRSTGPTFGF